MYTRSSHRVSVRRLIFVHAGGRLKCLFNPLYTCIIEDAPTIFTDSSIYVSFNRSCIRVVEPVVVVVVVVSVCTRHAGRKEKINHKRGRKHLLKTLMGNQTEFAVV